MADKKKPNITSISLSIVPSNEQADTDIANNNASIAMAHRQAADIPFALGRLGNLSSGALGVKLDNKIPSLFAADNIQKTLQEDYAGKKEHAIKVDLVEGKVKKTVTIPVTPENVTALIKGLHAAADAGDAKISDIGANHGLPREIFKGKVLEAISGSLDKSFPDRKPSGASR